MKHKPMTAQEYQKILDRDPKYQAMMAEKEKRRAELEAMLTADERPLTEALAAVGSRFSSAWDMVNTAESYTEALPVLAEHLQRTTYRPRTREGIARALTVNEARGPAARVVLEELKKLAEPKNADEDGFRFALANALITIGDASMQDDIQRMMDDPRYATTHVALERVLKRIPKRKLRR